jgi:hypothetical protein
MRVRLAPHSPCGAGGPTQDAAHRRAPTTAADDVCLAVEFGWRTVGKFANEGGAVFATRARTLMLGAIGALETGTCDPRPDGLRVGLTLGLFACNLAPPNQESA